MSDTLFNDISEYQVAVNDSYPYSFLAFRANDGTYRDTHFNSNLSWAKHSVKTKQLRGYIVYFVWEVNWQDTINTLKSQIGTPGPNTAILIDVESWGGKLGGNHSGDINQTREQLIKWLNDSRPALTRKLYAKRDRNRVIGYGNMGDLAGIWPQRGDANIIVAAYGSNPSVPHKIAHQFTDRLPGPPFGTADANSADGFSTDDLAVKLGLTKILHTIKKPKPIAIPKWPLSGSDFFGPGGRTGKDNNVVAQKAICIIQRKLIRNGFAGKVNPDTWVDGIYGKETEDAVRAFKVAAKIRNKTGQIHRPAWRKLMKLG